jgi:hypothetical protein
MSGHYICDACGYDAGHASYCKYLRPMNEQWMGNRTQKEVEELHKLTPTKVPYPGIHGDEG